MNKSRVVITTGTSAKDGSSFWCYSGQVQWINNDSDLEIEIRAIKIIIPRHAVFTISYENGSDESLAFFNKLIKNCNIPQWPC